MHVDKIEKLVEQLQTGRIRLVRLWQEYARFSEGVGLPMQHARAEAAGFTWKHGRTAECVTKGKRNLDPPASMSYNKKADEVQFENYRAVLRELVPISFEEFQKVKYGDPSVWKEMKSQYRTLNRYEVHGNVTAARILELDEKAWSTKQTGFSTEGLSGPAKKKVKGLAGNGNAAMMSIEGKTYFAHSRVGHTTDPGFKEYSGSHPFVTVKLKRRFEVWDLGDGIPRHYDTESRFLEYVADVKAPTDTFEVTILSEKHICRSCEHVDTQFREMFPNATVNIISGKPGYNNSPEGLKTWKHRKKVKTNA